MWLSRKQQPGTAVLQDLSATGEQISLTIQDLQGEHPSTYMVQQPSNPEELVRLSIQDQMLTTSMGGVLPEQTDLTSMRRILDAGCGTGGWLLETARTIPTLSLLVGVDVNKALITHARAQAANDPAGKRVSYHIMDVLHLSQFPQAFFDLVNQRLGISYLRTWDWPRLLGGYQRITRPGGIVRITESSGPESNSQALMQLNTLFLRALSQAGHLFVLDDSDSLINELVPLFKRQGFKNVQTRLHTLEYRTGTSIGEYFVENEKRLFRTLRPFLQKWSRVPGNYQEIYRQALYDMQSSDFVATWKLLTVWGTCP